MYEQIRPNLIIAGVIKAGTTSLFTYLSQHPDVCASSIKETQYFIPLRYGGDLEPIEEYLKYFQGYRGEKYVLEGTPGYFYGGSRIAEKLFEVLGKVQVVVILREPIGRLFSFYASCKSQVRLARDVTFDMYVESCQKYLESGRLIEKKSDRLYGSILEGFYIDYLEHWHMFFGDSLKILFFDDLKKDILLFMSQICSWLDIDPSFYSFKNLKIENRTAYYHNELFQRAALFVNRKFEKTFRRYPQTKDLLRKAYHSINENSHIDTISDKARTYLESIYEPYNRKLSAKLSSMGFINLPSWLSQ